MNSNIKFTWNYWTGYVYKTLNSICLISKKKVMTMTNTFLDRELNVPYSSTIRNIYIESISNVSSHCQNCCQNTCLVLQNVCTIAHIIIFIPIPCRTTTHNNTFVVIIYVCEKSLHIKTQTLLFKERNGTIS